MASIQLLWTSNQEDYYNVHTKWGMPAETGSITLTNQLIAGQDGGESYKILIKESEIAEGVPADEKPATKAVPMDEKSAIKVVPADGRPVAQA
jgi:hypothetical protein